MLVYDEYSGPHKLDTKKARNKLELGYEEALQMEFVLEAMETALVKAKPVIWNSD